MSVFLTLTLFLRGIADSIGTSNSPQFWFPVFSISRFVKVNASQPSSVVEFGFLRDPCLLFSSKRLFPILVPGLVSCRNRRIFDQCSMRNYWSIESFPEAPIRSSFRSLPGSLENFWQTASIESAHHLSNKPDRNNTAEVPLFCARLFPQYRSNRCGVQVRSFHDNSSQDSPNSNDCQHRLLSDFTDTSQKFLKLFSVS